MTTQPGCISGILSILDELIDEYIKCEGGECKADDDKLGPHFLTEKRAGKPKEASTIWSLEAEHRVQVIHGGGVEGRIQDPEGADTLTFDTHGGAAQPGTKVHTLARSA